MTAALWVFGVATLVRLVFALWLHPPGDFIVSDMWVYDHRAQRLLAGELGPWDTFTPVGYPALLAAIYAVFGRSFVAVAIVQALMGGTTAALTLLIARRLGGRVAPLPAAALVALHPGLVLYAALVMSETTFAFLLVLCLWLWLRSAEKVTLGRQALAGITLGVATVVRPNLLLLWPLLLPWLWVVHARRLRPALAHAGVALAIAVIPVAIASAHNSRLTGRVAGPATNGGLNFYLNFAEVRSARFVENGATHHIKPVPNFHRYTEVQSVERPFHDDRYYYRRGLELIAERPLRLGRALANLFEGSGVGNQRYWPGYQPIWLLLAVSSSVFFAIAIVPASLHLGWLAIRRRLLDESEAPRLLLGAALCSAALTLWLFLGDSRVRVPFDPVFAVLAADGIARATGWFIEHRRRKRSAALGTG